MNTLKNPDDIYSLLTQTHATLSPRQSNLLNAYIILLASQEIEGKDDAILKIIKKAQELVFSETPTTEIRGEIEHYGYFRSTADYRLRVALNFKKIDTKYVSIHLARSEGYQAPYKNIVSNSLVPAVVITKGVITQSLAIIEYLEAVSEGKRILANDHFLTAQIRSFAYSICCDIHPINNLRVQKYLVNNHQFSDEDKLNWMKHWMEVGFGYLEPIVKNRNRHFEFIFGGKPTLAEICLIPQLYNAHRFKLDLSNYPSLLEIEQKCLTLEEFYQAMPENQQDADL